MAQKRLSPDELLQRLMKFHRSQPEVLSEQQFRKRLQETTITRYRVGDNLLSEVQELLANLAKSGPVRKDKESIQLAVKKVADASVMLAYGLLAYNKAAKGRQRTVLWPGDTKHKPRD